MVNATGAGDATMAGILHATRKGWMKARFWTGLWAPALVAISGKDTINPDMSEQAIQQMIKEYVK